MTAGNLNALPPLVQAVLYSFIGLGIVAGALVSYFKSVRKEKASTQGVVFAGDSKAMDRLCAAIDRLGTTADRLDGSLERSTDAVRDSTEQAARLYRHLAAQAAMPPNEEILTLLRRIESDVRPDKRD